MARRDPAPSRNQAVYVISVAAEITGLHPQTLRQYDRLGLVSPDRTGGGGRRYSLRDIEQLQQIVQLTASGIGLEGVKRILELEHQVAALQARNRELRAREAALKAALDEAIGALRGRRPNLPALREVGTMVRLPTDQ